MIVLANFMLGIAQILAMLLQFFLIFIFINAVLSWFSPDPNNALVRIIDGVCEPVLAPFREKLPPFGGLDLSPLAAIAAIYLIQYVVVDSLRHYANVMKSKEAPITAAVDYFQAFDIVSGFRGVETLFLL